MAAILSWLVWQLLIVGFFWANCPCCDPCAAQCNESSPSPTQYQIVIAGIANGTCLTCANVNGTYVNTRSGGAPCTWPGTTTSVCAFPAYGGILQLILNGFFLTVSISHPAATLDIQWSNSYGAKHDCAYVAEAVALNLNPGNARCNGTAATCTVTAI